MLLPRAAAQGVAATKGPMVMGSESIAWLRFRFISHLPAVLSFACSVASLSLASISVCQMISTDYSMPGRTW